MTIFSSGKILVLTIFSSTRILDKCTIGRYCKLETNVYITAYSVVEDRVFVAPGVLTSNDNYIGRTEERGREETVASGRPATADSADERSQQAVHADERERDHGDRGRPRLGADAPGPARLTGGREELRSLLANLVDNALRYAPRGSEVTVAARNSGARVELEVSDAGPGIPPEQRARVTHRDQPLDQAALGLLGQFQQAEVVRYGCPLEPDPLGDLRLGQPKPPDHLVAQPIPVRPSDNQSRSRHRQARAGGRFFRP